MVKKCLVLVLFSLACLNVRAQQEQLALPDLLTKLEDRFGIKFTYADENVKDLKIAPPSETLNLQEALNYLSNATGLRFKQLENNFIAIIKPKEVLINICGRLIDAISDKPVPGASIQIGNEFTISNDNGYFEINIPESNQPVTIYSFTFSPLVFNAHELSKKPCLTIKMQPLTITLRKLP